MYTVSFFVIKPIPFCFWYATVTWRSKTSKMCSIGNILGGGVADYCSALALCCLSKSRIPRTQYGCALLSWFLEVSTNALTPCWFRKVNDNNDSVLMCKVVLVLGSFYQCSNTLLSQKLNDNKDLVWACIVVLVLGSFYQCSYSLQPTPTRT